MPIWCRKRGRAPGFSLAGFSLIEVLVALAIVGLALAAIVSVFGNGRLGLGAAGDIDAALTIAEAKLDAVGITETLRPGQSEGIFQRFRWQLAVAPYDDRDKPGTETATAALRLFRVEVTVSWREGPRARQVALATLRLAPAPP